ncbi:MAG TPA: sugar ABC transporter permease [Galbitalea sp.]|jgi:multiple sugar transport system permease protein
MTQAVPGQPLRLADRSPARRRSGRGSGAAPWVFLAPFIVLFLMFLVAPIVVAIGTSLFKVQKSGLGFDTASKTVFVGIQNYATALADPAFIAGFGRVLLFGIVQVPVMLALALIFALLLDSARTKFKRVLRLGVFLPFAIPGVVAALLWGFLYQPGVSPIVEGLKSIGISVDFLSSGSVLWSIANVSTWSYTGVNMIILFSALQTVPRELFEAARIDGAGELRTAFSIKVPLIAPALLLTALFSVIGTLQLFNEPTILKNLTTNITTEYTPNMAVFATTQANGNLNLGSAMAIILGLVTFILSVVVSSVSNRRGRNA